MAILIEEKRSKANLPRLIGWLVVIVILGVAIYYLFFVAPPSLVIIVPPEELRNIAPISQVSLHPEDVLNSPGFQLLKPPTFPLPSPQGPASVGRANPFVAP